MKIFNKLEEWLGGILFIVLFAIMLLQIFSRQILDSPLIWSEELSRFIFIYVGILGISIGIKNHQHIFIDFIYSKFPKKIQKHISTFIEFIVLACILCFLYFGYKVYIKKEELEIVSLGISYKWMYLALPLISILMLFRWIQAYIKFYKEDKLTINPKIAATIMIILIVLLIFKPEVFTVFKLSNYFDLGDKSIYVALVIWLIIMFLGVPVGLHNIN